MEGIEAEEGTRCEPEGKAVWGALPGEGRHAPGSCQVQVDIGSAEASRGTGERAAAVKMCGYEGSNPNFIREVGEAKTDLDSAEEMAIGQIYRRLRSGRRRVHGQGKMLRLWAVETNGRPG